VTHVVAARDGSAKLRYAHSLPAEQRPHIVHVSWLWHSLAHFQRGDEAKFPLWPENNNGNGPSSSPPAVDGAASADGKTDAQTKPAAEASSSPSEPSPAIDLMNEGSPAPPASSPAAATPTAPVAAAPAAAAAPATGGSGKVAPIRRRIPKKAHPPPSADESAGTANAAAAAPAVPAASSATAAAPDSSPSASLSSSTATAAPVPGTVGLHLVHHVASPPSVESLVERVHALLAREDALRHQHGGQEAEAVREEEVAKAAKLRRSMGSARKGSAVPMDGAGAQQQHERRKSVTFSPALFSGPSNPHYATDVHTAPHWSDDAMPAPSPSAGVKRKAMSSPGASASASAPASFPLDDLERAKQARLEQASSANSGPAGRSAPSSLSLSTASSRRAPAAADDDDDEDFDAMAEHLLDDLWDEQQQGGGDGEGEQDYEHGMDFGDERADGADYGESEHFDDDD